MFDIITAERYTFVLAHAHINIVCYVLKNKQKINFNWINFSTAGRKQEQHNYNKARWNCDRTMPEQYDRPLGYT